MPAETGIHFHARGDRIDATLASRAVRLDKDPYRRFHHVLALGDGWARLAAAHGEPESLRGPGLAYLPPAPGAVLTIDAGAEGLLVGVSPEIMADAIGNKAESYALRIFAEQPFVAGEMEAAAFGETGPLLQGFVREVGDPGRESWMVVSAYMRLVLMAMWRMSASARSDQRGRGETASLLQRYRQQVEVHFREHRSIQHYAQDLGVTTDRLHAVCQRALGRSPIQLLHERLIHEARLRLERSAGTIQQISDELGFRDATYFSHFFKRRTAMSPAAYRGLARDAAGRDRIALSSSYADWP